MLIFAFLQLTFPSIMLLYSITVIFIHVTTLTRSQASGRYLGAIHVAHDILDHYDHPAARVGQVSRLMISGFSPFASYCVKFFKASMIFAG